uniref:Large ribosomal subunit protein bL32c n=1 Tax=Austrocedrus chilensis TaxID=103964 RepID=A0A6J4AH06_AUSCH|nr:ribosomal protein L32 [Austrocedrus chilensis]BBN66417.1 ribosomal protein L32 [Austrocedrus chilensis]
MAVPKKRTSKSKKKHRNKVWRKKANSVARKALSYIRSESKLGDGDKLVPLTPVEKREGFSSSLSRRKGIKKKRDK